VRAEGERDLGKIADSELTKEAFELAQRAHLGQEGKRGGSPYIRHPLAVARLLEQFGCDEGMLAAALLHDVVEGSELSVGDVVERFGTDVGELVAALTEDDSISDYERRKGHHRRQVEEAGPRAVTIYVADKLANVRDLRELYREIGERVVERDSAPNLDVHLRLWRDDAEMAERVIPESPLPQMLRGELDAFQADRAQRRAAVSSR
jgi:(p)ppGpp synthase/HD superfamily hydrolase